MNGVERTKAVKDVLSNLSTLTIAELELTTFYNAAYNRGAEDAVTLREVLAEVLHAWKYDADQGDGIMEEHGEIYDRALTMIA